MSKEKPGLAAGTGSSVVVRHCQICQSPDLEPVLFLGYLPPVNLMPKIGEPPCEQASCPALLVSLARIRPSPKQSPCAIGACRSSRFESTETIPGAARCPAAC